MTQSMKIAIDNILPESKQELSYIVNELGSVLFRDDWGKIKPPQLTELKKYKLFESILQVIFKAFNKNDQNELINYFFSSSLNRLIN